MLRRFCSTLVLLWIGFGLAACTGFINGKDNRHNQPLAAATTAALQAMGSSPKAPMLVRIYKEERTLEIWKQTTSGRFAKFKDYEICAYSGGLGPKVKEGDRQSPEGFYTITPGLMNPKSNYYLAFNTGFPNKYDQAHGRSGSYLMVHGDCKSVGCYAMTDAGIAEIFALARESFKGGNASFQVQIFPFRMTSANLAAHADDPNLPFWRNIKEGADLFDLNAAPPLWDVCEGRYVFNASGTMPLDALGPCPVATPNPGLVARQEADDQAVHTRLAALDRAQSETAVIKARGEAINGAVSGFFGSVGGVFGAGADATAIPAAASQPAPQPLPAGSGV